MDLQTLMSLRLKALNASEHELIFAKTIFSTFPINRSGFEICSNEKTIDIAILFRKNKGDFYHFSNTEYGDVFDPNEWEKIIKILKLLNNSPRFKNLNSLWLEFDIKYYRNSQLPVPGIYLSVDELRIKKSLEVLTSLLSKNICNRIKNSFKSLIQNITIPFTIEHVGFFPVRGNDKVRFVFRLTYNNFMNIHSNYRLYNTEIIELLHLIESEIYTDICIHFDLSEKCTELQGIEIYPRTKCLNSVLSKLVKFNWLSQENSTKAMNWKCAYALPTNMKKKFKTKLDHRVYPHYHAARVSHLKIINKTNKVAKVYLGSESFGFLNPEEIAISLSNKNKLFLQDINGKENNI